MAAADYDLCIITQERFSPDTSSELCPMVGECGHSFTKQGIQNWYKGRKSDGFHMRKSYVPCAYKCARKCVNKKGQRVEEQIEAFKASNLVPNVALCEALAVIRRVEADEEKKGNEDFVHCTLCQNDYSAAAAPPGLQHHLRAPIVGVCGHTFCASCIYDKHQEAMQDSKCDNLSHVKCPQCQKEEAFDSLRLVSNHSLKDALIRWEEISGPVDYRDLYRNEKVKCNATKDLHDKEIENLKNLLKQKTSKYEALRKKHTRELEAQAQLIELSSKGPIDYGYLYSKEKAKCDSLRDLHDKEMETQRDLLKRITAEYDALKILLKSEIEDQMVYKDLYEKKTAEYDALKAECDNERTVKDEYKPDNEMEGSILQQLMNMIP